MKGMGSILLLCSGLLCRRVILGRLRRRIALGEALCRGLDLLRRGVYRQCTPLPELFIQCREAEDAAAFFWDALAAGLAGEEGLIPLWERCCALLPPIYGTLLLPLGGALHGGEQEELLLLSREELTRTLREQRRELAEQSKLVSALCVSASLLLAVVLL